MKNKARILELDVLRGLAAMAVILFHYTFKYNEEYGPIEIPFSFEYGHFGVELFFILSGYVIFMTVNKIETVKKFLWLRFSRLFPVYWSGIVITIGFVLVFGLSGREVSWKSMLFNFTMLQELFDIPHVDGAYWSLLPELMFYFLMAFLILIKKKTHIHLVNLIWIVGIILNHYVEFPIILEQILNLKYGMLFIAGIEFYLLKHGKKTVNSTPIILGLISLTLISYYLTFENLIGFFIVVFFYILFVLLNFDLLSFLKVKFLVFLGAISYPLYIVHQNVGYILMNYLNLNFWLELFLSILLSILIATMIHYFIEKPSLAYLRTKSKK